MFSKKTFATRELAEKAGVRLGCSGSHMVRQGVWLPCSTPEIYNAAKAHSSVGGSTVLRMQRPTRRVVNNRRVWDSLRERGPKGIETLPGGGLVSGKAVREARKEIFLDFEEKRFYTRKRRTEYSKRGWALPDGSFPIRDVGDLRNAIQAFGLGKNRAAAKRHIMKRARQLGKLGLIPDSWKKRGKSEFVESISVKAKKYDPKTPAKPSEMISGSKLNKPGSTSNDRGKIKLSSQIDKSLTAKVKDHNEKMKQQGKPELRVTQGMLRSVWRRGSGAFSKTHRPKMGRQQWAMGRVNSFLHLVSSGKPKNSRYTTDNDLLPKKHKRSTRRIQEELKMAQKQKKAIGKLVYIG